MNRRFIIPTVVLFAVGILLFLSVFTVLVNPASNSLVSDQGVEISAQDSTGDVVVITAGAFEAHEGKVELVTKHKATVLCMVFGRSTPLEVDLKHLAKIDN